MTSETYRPGNSFFIFISVFLKLVLYLIGSSLIMAGMFFLTKHTLHESGITVFISSLTLSLGILFWEFNKNSELKLSRLGIYILASLAIIFVLTFLMGKVYDKSWDGLFYHQITIVELSNGWNPFYEELPETMVKSKYIGDDIIPNLWINHYGKANEICSAVIMSVTNNIESGKVLNVLLFLVAFCSTLYMLVKLKIFNVWWSVSVAFAVSFNPIFVNQLFSYYLDGTVASVLLILVAQLILLLYAEEKERRHVFISLFFTAIILINLKFTAAFYFALICFVFLCAIIYLKPAKLFMPFLIVASMSSIVAVFIAGFNPYVSNTVNYGHPFYPLAGKNKIDVIVGMVPKAMLDENNFVKFLSSNFSRCDNFSTDSDREINYKLPFTFSVAELKKFQGEAIRLGGLGPLWSGIFCLTLILFSIACIKLKGKKRIVFLILFVTVMITVVTNPAAWWARLVPQLWMLPVIVMATILYTQSESKWLKLASRVGVVLMIINSMLIGSIYFFAVYKSNKSTNMVFKQLKKSTEPLYVYFDIFTPNEKKLLANHINYIKIDDPTKFPCDSTYMISRIEYCRKP